MPTDLTPAQALQRLRDGNDRFVQGADRTAQTDIARRDSLATGQSPIAAVLACADSRVAPELVFDEGLGEIFSVRNAGQIAEPVGIGSLEYAVAVLGAPVVLVLRHTSCGAVKAAAHGGELPAANIAAVVDAVAPSVQSASAGLADGAAVDPEAVGAAHLEATLKTLFDQSGLISDRVAAGTLALAGGTYDIATGQVEISTVVGA
jgi:carbonic anhydrase